MSLKLRYALFLLICLPVVGFAQLRVYGPLRTTPEKIPSGIKAKRNAPDTVSLPFWDDFSFADGHAADSLWIVNNRVTINSGQAINPPSLNVATFDGYNEFGVPYSTVALEVGFGDTLESQPIDLGSVLSIHRNSVYLSFFYQAGGNGDMPDNGDYLKLEFRDVDSTWREIARFETEDNADPSIFYDTAIQVPAPPITPGDSPNYFYKGFQFRFVSFGRISGGFDAWHLDYVYLNRRVNDNEETYPGGTGFNINENDKNTNISDRTITQPLSSIFAHGYYSIPYAHFLKDVDYNLENPTLSFYNLIDAEFPQSAVYKCRVTITNYTDSIATTVFQDSTFTKSSIGPLNPILSRQYSFQQIPVLPSSANLSFPADSSKITVDLFANLGDMNTTIDYFARYTPINFNLNNTISQTYLLADYYAYDDGIAEYSATLAAQGNQLAYRFVMNPDVVEDNVLNGLYIYFPFAGGTAPETMQIFIFRDKAGKPDSMWTYRQTIPVTRTANNVFSEINFTKGVVVTDTFYVGYLETQTSNATRIIIGLDTSHDTGDQIYYRNTVYHQWQPNLELKGSLMIRPRFGEAEVITGIEDELKPISIYPNPNRGEFFIKGHVDNLQLITITGQSVNFTTETLNDTQRVTLQNAAPGVYIVRYRSGSRISTNKILVTGY